VKLLFLREIILKLQVKLIVENADILERHIRTRLAKAEIKFAEQEIVLLIFIFKLIEHGILLLQMLLKYIRATEIQHMLLM
jgi:hypothetical protein